MIQTFETVPVSQKVFYRRMKRYIAAHPPPEPLPATLELQNETTAGIAGKLKAILYDNETQPKMHWLNWAIRFEVSPQVAFHQTEWDTIKVVAESKPEYDDYLNVLLDQAKAWLTASR